MRTLIAYLNDKRMSVAGAQHKLPVVYRDDELYEPVGREPSTHILKPDHQSDDYPASVINEYAMQRLAARLAGDALGLNRRTSERELERMAGAMLAALQAVRVEIETQNADGAIEAKVFFAGEMRLLRAVEHVVLPFMLERVGRLHSMPSLSFLAGHST